MYAWKDYSDGFFVTVSINATGFGAGATAATGNTLYGTLGQLLHTSPSIYNSAASSGQMTLWSQVMILHTIHNFSLSQALIKMYLQYVANTTGLPNYLSSDLLVSSLASWSCFTYAISLSAVCNPTTSVYKRGYGCVLRGTTTTSTDTANLAGTTSLFFTPQFNFTR